MLYRPKIPIAIERYLLDGAIIALLIKPFMQLPYSFTKWVRWLAQQNHQWNIEYFQSWFNRIALAAHISSDTSTAMASATEQATHPLGAVFNFSLREFFSITAVNPEFSHRLLLY